MKNIAFCLIFLTIVAAAEFRGAELSVRKSAQPASTHRWESVGPTPPAIGAAIAAHAPSHTIYIGGEGGSVLKSTDGGATFVALKDGPQGVFSMVMDPNDPNRRLCGGRQNHRRRSYLDRHGTRCGLCNGHGSD